MICIPVFIIIVKKKKGHKNLSNRNAFAKNCISFHGINYIKIPGAIHVEIYIQLFSGFGLLIYSIQKFGCVFVKTKKPELCFKEFITVLLLTGAKERYKMNLISFTIHGLYGTVLNT